MKKTRKEFATSHDYQTPFSLPESAETDSADSADDCLMIVLKFTFQITVTTCRDPFIGSTRFVISRQTGNRASLPECFVEEPAQMNIPGCYSRRRINLGERGNVCRKRFAGTMCVVKPKLLNAILISSADSAIVRNTSLATAENILARGGLRSCSQIVKLPCIRPHLKPGLSSQSSNSFSKTQWLRIHRSRIGAKPNPFTAATRGHKNKRPPALLQPLPDEEKR